MSYTKYFLDGGESMMSDEIEDVLCIIFKTIKENADPKIFTVNKLELIFTEAIKKLKNFPVKL